MSSKRNRNEKSQKIMGVSGRDEEICAIQSPMTQLTESMKELQTDKRFYHHTPRRKLSLGSNTPTPKVVASTPKMISSTMTHCHSEQAESRNIASDLEDSPFLQEKYIGENNMAAKGLLSLKSLVQIGCEGELMSPVSDFSVSFLSPSTCDSSQETNNSFIVPKMDIKKRPTTDDSQHLDIGNVSGRNAARKVGSKHVSKCIWPKKMRISMDDEAERKENLSAPQSKHSQDAHWIPKLGHRNQEQESAAGSYNSAPAVKCLNTNAVNAAPPVRGLHPVSLNPVPPVKDLHPVGLLQPLATNTNPVGMFHSFNQLFSSPIIELDETMASRKKRKPRRRIPVGEDQENRDPNLQGASEFRTKKAHSDNKPAKAEKRPKEDDEIGRVPVKRHKGSSEVEAGCCATKIPGPIGTEASSHEIIPSTSTAEKNKFISPRRYMRCHSEILIKSALTRADEHQELIGDFSKPSCLPLVRGKHHDLKSISANTLAKALDGGFESCIEHLVIVDCRYPYEYDGGHIKGSLNIYTKDGIITAFLSSTEYHQKETTHGKHTILVFHCEFSSERGPKLMHFLRNTDRQLHLESYPKLFYPEMYLLEGGYKAFYELHKSLCEPSCYKPMTHNDHVKDLKHFRSKSKSWAGEKSQSSAVSKVGTKNRACRKLP